ncbi:MULTISPECIES: exodeoxyribonuclease VII large subunit [Enterobacterales]|jgi:exodeoxyribonuclease VII large subunit|uniref:exodeoxyribonuclease VII large subunit n=1 Tax=Enterobacterales TaxID=91347 RepID=UPI0015CBEB73|nr:MULTISPECIES: exodeoxyribonuclease VII large subunit [Enterobacterales]MBB3304494.1 exodeoxyribonuclease VII large subunit [Enterobacter sp. Sphag1F]NYI12402.1 exodeoxyribonuclease VII large subunit [Enterobacter sp. Sphag71]UVC28369.1 exodeoxyribonuclease VII large subunit [Pantoea sp. SOD02]
MSLPPTANIFTVSRLNTTVRQLLENEMGLVWLSAEISNFTQPSSGHWYFTLKDDGAQVRCAMFRNSNRRVTFRPQHGQQVLVRASITLYEPRGDYQLIIESMHPAGEGLLQQQFEQLKARLAAEGLFDQQFKQPLPDPARQVGVITSATGAALHDVLRVLHRRDPSLPVIIYPTAVQGVDAPASIVRAIELANQRDECDVLIVGRGGGSLEDLWSFNDERVARAIFASRLPIVSAVGHETDVTIADFVADLRAPTPSAAAELVSRNQLELLRRLQSQQQRMEMAMDFYLAQQQRRFTRIQHRLQQQHPQLRLARQQTALFQLQRRLGEAMDQRLRVANRQQDRLLQRLNAQQPQGRILRAQQQLQQWHYRLQQGMEKQLNHNRQRFGTLAAQLEGVSPLATLARGFSVTTDTQGQVVKKTQQLSKGDLLRTRLDDGWVESQVTALEPQKSRSRKARS